MLQLLVSLKGLTKFQTVSIDNQVFKLHYKFTTGVLALFSLIVSYNQFFGDAIACTTSKSQNAPKEIVQLYCWSHHTYSVKEAFEKPVGGPHGVVYPGVAQPDEDDEIVQHKYYQWVCFVLALQAIMFYFPRYLWKACEGETVKNLVLGLNVSTLESEEVSKKQELLIRYFQTHRARHQWYIIKYVFCEFLNLANVVGQTFLLDTFFGGEFTTYGIRVLQFLNDDPRERVDPMVKLFPRMAICHFTNYGPTGQPVQHDVYCVLPLNIINEKIFIFLWFWFTILLNVSICALLYRFVVLVCPAVRRLLLKLRSPMSEAKDIDKVTWDARTGDWFIVYQLAKNVETFNMAELLEKRVKALDSGQKHYTLAASSTGENQ